MTPQQVAQFRDSENTMPLVTPAMPGGLFAMDRKFWEKLGKYDLGMNVWGVRWRLAGPRRRPAG